MGVNNMEIKYIENFEKLTKKQKLEIEPSSIFGEIEINRLILIPTNKKSNGYCVGQFFAYTEGKGWWKPMTYDCWSVVTDINTNQTAIPRFTILRGDFEHGGVQIFGFIDEYHKAYISYGGQITIRKVQ